MHKIFFKDTLAISDRSIRTVFEKYNAMTTDMIDIENRRIYGKQKKFMKPLKKQYAFS